MKSLCRQYNLQLFRKCHIIETVIANAIHSLNFGFTTQCLSFAIMTGYLLQWFLVENNKKRERKKNVYGTLDWTTLCKIKCNAICSYIKTHAIRNFLFVLQLLKKYLKVYVLVEKTLHAVFSCLFLISAMAYINNCFFLFSFPWIDSCSNYVDFLCSISHNIILMTR